MNHLSENDIAYLVSGTCSPKDRDHFTEHLKQCSECFDDLTLALRVEVGQAPYAGTIPSVDELLRVGATVAAERRRGRVSRWRLPLFATGAAAVAALLLFMFVGGDSPYPTPAEAQRGIYDAMVNISNRGYIVMPSTEDAIAPDPSTMRSSPVTDRDLPGSQLTNGNRADADAVFWEVGRLISDGGYMAAARVAEEGLKLSPGDPGLAHLRALATYYDGNRGDAIAQMQRVVDLYPDDATALINLAAMLEESDREVEATQLLERAVACAGDEPLRNRAEWLLERFEE